MWGIVKAILVNLSDKTFTVRVGDRIAQLKILEKYNVNFEKLGERILLGGAKRGSSGFGSADVNVIKTKQNLMIGLLNLLMRKLMKVKILQLL